MIPPIYLKKHRIPFPQKQFKTMKKNKNLLNCLQECIINTKTYKHCSKMKLKQISLLSINIKMLK